MLALALVERGCAAALVAGEGAQVLMASGPSTPLWVLLAFAAMMLARLTLWLCMPGCLLGWLAADLLSLRRG
ncbi:MAG: hypothetical protein H6740_14330 [Alphaproteobacteria bacterium]|nr:hypothetical protein [Alphaproteobacteria bacterium]